MASQSPAAMAAPTQAVRNACSRAPPPILVPTMATSGAPFEGTHAYLAHPPARDAQLLRELLERDRVSDPKPTGEAAVCDRRARGKKTCTRSVRRSGARRGFARRERANCGAPRPAPRADLSFPKISSGLGVVSSGRIVA